MMGCHKQVRAVNSLVDLFVSFVLHVKRIVCLNTVYYDLLWKLNSESVLINGDLFYVVTTSDFDASFSHQVLDDYICHQLTISVSFLVKTVHTIEVHSVRHNIAVV